MTREELDEFERNNPGSSKLREIIALARLGLTAREAVDRLWRTEERRALLQREKQP